jgi:hypothetical protein
MNATINTVPNSPFKFLKNVCLCQENVNLGFRLGTWLIKLQNFQTFHD